MWLQRSIFTALVITVGGAATYGVLQIVKPGETGKTSLQQAKTAPSLIDDPTLQTLKKVDRSSITTRNLAKSLVPPTNTWFSSILTQTPQPLFTYPQSVLLQSDGVDVGLPTVTATSDVIMGSHISDVRLRLKGAVYRKLVRSDELTIDVAYYKKDGTKLATVTLAAGLPYVYVNAHTAVVGSLNVAATPRSSSAQLLTSGKYFGVYPVSSIAGKSVRLSSNQTLTIFGATNKSSYADIARHAKAIVTGGEVSFSRDGDTFTTTFRYITRNNTPTLFARLPHQEITVPSEKPRYPSIFGTMTTSAGTAFGYQIPALDVVPSLDIEKLSSAEKDLLRTTLVAETNNLPGFKTDTYFGGKQLQRTAQLLDIASQLEAAEQKRQLATVLRGELEAWLSKDRFEYDAKAHAIVGREASFGSDKDVNDHHFHYGYFVYASAVLAKYDQSFYDTHKHMVNLLVADIANYKDNEQLPMRRNFDVYAGHSWASGTAAFTDGNNQESTSEAINAWVGVALWADMSKNDTLRAQADWMLAHEAATAKRYWLNQPQPKDEYLRAYTSPLASLVWGGKREYKTFFSDEANAKLAIQLLPLTPTMQRYASNLPASVFAGSDTAKIYGDTILMARKNSTINDAKKMPDNLIDDGNSRTYLYAYMLTR